MNILKVPMRENSAQATTIGDYLTELMVRVWTEDEDFSGKRPFGYSCWKLEVYEALVNARIIDGSFDEDGYLEECDQVAGNKLVHEALAEIKEMVNG